MASSLFALLIGIDTYPADPSLSLKWAVADAELMRDYLQMYLHVPEENICLLVDSDATHDAIVARFRSHLIDNAHICTGDPIVFYFAGRGTRYAADHTWPANDGHHDAFCPFDRGAVGWNGAVIGDIMDLTLGSLLADLAETRGDNVLAIFDTCHTDGGVAPDARSRTRFAPGLRSAAARLRMREQAEACVDARIREAMSTNVGRFASSRLGGPLAASHVLLAACGADGQAWEADAAYAGAFTAALLETLKHGELPRLSYAALMADVGALPMQTPQLEGRHRKRLVFNGKALGINKRLVPIERTPSGQLRVEAGEIHGVSCGTLFSVQPHRWLTLDKTGTGTVTVVKVDAVWCLVEPVDPTFSPQPNSYAAVSYWANVKNPFYVGFYPQHEIAQRQELVEAGLDRIASGDHGEVDVVILRGNTDPGSGSSAMVFVSEHEMVVERCDPLTTGLWTLDFTWKRTGFHDEWEILALMGRFHFHLYRENPTHPFRESISIALVRLSSDMQLTRGNCIVDGRADVEYDPKGKTLYSLVMHNASGSDLWCSVYYFDPADYTIVDIYTPSSPTIHPPLRKYSDFTLGYGANASVSPFSFSMKHGQPHDTGFLKIFVSDHYADLTMMEQGHPFEHLDLPQAKTFAAPEGVGRWDTLMATVNVASVASTAV